MFLLLIGIAFGLLYLLDYYKRQFWIKKGVLHPPSIPFFGHFYPVVAQQATAFGVYDTQCHNFQDKPYFGVYEFWRPTLVVKDLNLIEHILIKDFSSFLDHPRWIFDPTSIVHDSLFNMKGNKWRALRYQTIPWFTTGRMKSLFPSVLNCMSIPKGEFEVMSFIRLLEADTIATFFGVQIGDKDGFQEIIKNFHDVSNFRYYKIILIEHFSKLTDFVGITLADHATDNYFRNFTKSILANKNHSLIQRLWKLVEEQTVKLRKKDLYSNSEENEVLSYEVTEDVIVNIVGQFLIAGLDTTGNQMVWLLYDLAMNPEVQQKARTEIRTTLKNHGGWSYEALQEMKYVANCVTESMRLHPTLPFMFRTCTTTYTTPDGLTIDKGTKIVIPSLTIHKDPKIYPEPELFKPERFDDVGKNTNLAWLPFGEGPRKCAGMRFSLMAIKTMMSHLLENHELIFTEKTILPAVNNDKTFLGRPLNKLYVKLNKVM